VALGVPRAHGTIRTRSVTAIPLAGDPQEVFGAVPLAAPAERKKDGTRCQRRTALGLKQSGKPLAKSAPRRSLALDNRGLIRVRQGPRIMCAFPGMPRTPIGSPHRSAGSTHGQRMGAFHGPSLGGAPRSPWSACSSGRSHRSFARLAACWETRSPVSVKTQIRWLYSPTSSVWAALYKK
jgi:hypothetical protein